MAEKEEKKAFTLLDLAKTLNKEFKSPELLRVADVVPAYKRLKSGALGMDYALFGGLPYGRVVVFSGEQHSGKTSGAMAFLAAYQRENPDKVCLFVDVEQSLDIKHQALMNGVDLNKLIILTPDVGMSAEQIFDIILRAQLETGDIGLMVIDSIPALETAYNLKNEFTKDMGKKGTIAAPLQKFLREILPALRKKNNILILINQVRLIGETYNGYPIYDEPGGWAPKYYSSVSIRFGLRKFMKGAEEIGSSDGQGADGFKIFFKIFKNKTASCSRGGGFITYRYETGMDKVWDLIQIGELIHAVEKLNQATYRLVNPLTGEVLYDENGKELKGYKSKLLEYLDSHPKFKDEFYNLTVKSLSASNDISLLSDEEREELDKEEESIDTKDKEKKKNSKVVSDDDELVEENGD